MGLIKDMAINTSLGVTSTAGIIGDLISQSSHREILPDFYQEHAGNFGLPWCLTVIVNLIGRVFELRGISENSPSLATLGSTIRNYGNVFVLGLLMGVEGQFINNISLLKENAGDLAVGLVAIIIGIGAGKGIAEKITHPTVPPN